MCMLLMFSFVFFTQILLVFVFQPFCSVNLVFVFQAFCLKLVWSAYLSTLPGDNFRSWCACIVVSTSNTKTSLILILFGTTGYQSCKFFFIQQNNMILPLPCATHVYCTKSSETPRNRLLLALATSQKCLAYYKEKTLVLFQMVTSVSEGCCY